MVKEYKKRIADALLARKLAGKGAVLIEGAKWCGKTTTAEQCAESIIYLSDPAKVNQYLDMVDLNPQGLLSGATPRLIDEWQIAPKLWDAIRFEVDHRDEMGQFILTGSAVPPSFKDIRHTGTGRFAWLKMRPMSLYESGESNGSVSLRSLFDNPVQIDGTNPIAIDQLAFLICRGGWPRASMLSEKIALDQAFDYYDAVVNTDASRVDGVERAPERVRHLMRSYARHQGSQTNNQVICADLTTNGIHSANVDTVAGYLNALRKIYVIEDLPAWSPNLRSKTAIRTSDTRYFTDQSIAVAALGVGPSDLINDLNTFGLLFETMCIRDLRVFAEANDGSVYHYRDAAGLECDAVVHLRNGAYGLVEIKLGGDRLIAEGSANLIRLAEKIDTTKMPAPSFKMILTGIGDFAYKNKDGIYIVPLSCLKD